MPTIKFKLKDPKKCNGCMLLDELHWIGGGRSKCLLCKKFGFRPKYVLVSKNSDKIKFCKETKQAIINRPQSCIDKYGE